MEKLQPFRVQVEGLVVQECEAHMEQMNASQPSPSVATCSYGLQELCMDFMFSCVQSKTLHKKSKKPGSAELHLSMLQ